MRKRLLLIGVGLSLGCEGIGSPYHTLPPAWLMAAIFAVSAAIITKFLMPKLPLLKAKAVLS